MSVSTPDVRLDRLLSSSPELAAYERWLEARRRAAGGERRDYLFLEDRPRFEPRREDVGVVLPGIEVRADRGATAVVVPAGPGRTARVDLPGVGLDEARRALAAIDGERTLLEARWEAGLAPEPFARVLRAIFGLVVLAPRAVADLEARVPCVEIVRHPASPYAVERAYWENAGDVAAGELVRREDLRAGGEPFVRALRELHVLQLMGADLDRFYQPASPASLVAVDPGSFARDAQALVERPGGPLVILSGLRVLAPAPLGPRAFGLLAESVGDPGAADDGGRSVLDAGIPWGRVARGRGDGDDAPRTWFLPPRPIDERHLEALADAFRAGHAAADAGDGASAIAAAARLHARFVRLHPFRCANQSVAMALVNAIVRRVTGVGLPHLVLDHLALRLAPAAYERVLARAVATFAVPGLDPAARLATIRGASRAAMALGDRMAGLDEAAARDLAHREPDVARAALLVDVSP